MGIVVNGSPDLSTLDVCVTWNISGNSPQIDLVNHSTGNNLANVQYAFIIKSPSQTYIHNIDPNTPDIVGVWNTWTFYSQNPDPTLSPPATNYTVAPWPRPFAQIEWSGAPYSIWILAKDSLGQVFDYTIYQDICPPVGSTNKSQNTYGKGKIDISVQCNQAQAFFENLSNTSYQGLPGTQQSSVLKVLYPDDQTDTAPQPFIINNFSSALVPVTYDSENYEFVYNAIYKYDFPNCSSVLIRYYVKSRFAITCNIDLCPLVCEYVKLIEQSETGNCENLQDINEKLLLINGKMNLALIAKNQPLCGIDLPALIEEIKAIGGFDCDCCSPAGIQPFNSANLGAYNFAIRSACGDISGYPEIVGNNITFVLSDKSYIFKICDTAPTQAFTVSPSTNGCQKTFCMNVDMATLATDILSTIQNNVDLVNMFNNIVNSGGQGVGDLLVDGKCIFKLTTVSDYTWGLVSVPASPVNAIITGIFKDGSVRVLNFAFNLSSLPALQGYLNGLGIGTFAVTNPSGSNVSIVSTANTNELGAIYYNISATAQLSAFSVVPMGFVPLSANQVVQNIINYLCDLTDNQLVTSQNYEICYIDPDTLQKIIVTVPSGTVENTFISQLLDKNCDTIDYIMGLGRVDCDNVKSLFPQSPQLMQANDYLLGTKVGDCAQILPIELLKTMLQQAFFNADVFQLFCQLNAACAGGLACAPYTIYQILVVEGSPTNLMNIVVTFTHPDAIKNTIRYARIDNTTTPVYTVIPNVLPGDSPYTISGINDGQYVVGITPIYADGRTCGEVILNTGFPSSGFNAFSARFDGTDIIVSYNAPGGMPKVRVNINYPNGGVFSQIYTNTGTDINITPPTGVYGNYTVTMTPVYNETTGYFGQTTAPVIFNVTPPNNSQLINNTTNALVPISMTITDSGNVITVPFNVASVSGSGGIINFYVPVVQIATAIITFGSGIVGAATLVAGATFVGVVTANHVNFPAIDALATSGITITLIDTSP